MAYTYETVTVKRSGDAGNIAILSLNRPQVFNAVNKQSLIDMHDALLELDRDDGVHVLILSGGESKHFCSGADLKELKNGDGLAFARMLSAWHSVTDLKKPVIAAVTGVALGGGCELALMADIIYCGTSSRFALPEVSHGTIPGCGGTQRLTAAVGKSRAMEMILSGDRITAAEAERWGLVSRVFPDEEVLEQAIKLAHRISSHSRPIVGMAKQAIKAFVDHSLAGMPVERELFHATFEPAGRSGGVGDNEHGKQTSYGHL